MNNFDYIIVGIYLTTMIACGILLRGRQESAEDYFAGGGLMGGRGGRTLVGLSIAATYFSGISFVAIPSIALSAGTKVFFILLVFPIAWIVVDRFFLPRYFFVRSLYPYEIVSARLGSRVRTAISTLFVLLRLGWMAALVYAPTIVILTIMRLDETWFWPVILLIGITSTLYTVLGGLRGVIVTDAIQMVVIIVGLTLILIFAFRNLPFDPALWVTQLTKTGVINVPSPSLSPQAQFTIWGILIGMSVSNIASYVADQMSLQRFLATGSLQSAKQSFRVGVIASMVTVALLITIGLAVLLYYSFHQDSTLPEEADRVFPHFIALALPTGLSGLVVAAILAATMSSITSGINTLAGCITIDFIRPHYAGLKDRAMLAIGRWVSLGVGLVATGLAGMIVNTGTIFDISQTVIGIFIGPIMAIVIMAVSSARRPSELRCITAILIGCSAGVAVAISPAQSIWISASAFTTTLLVCLVPPHHGTTGANRSPCGAHRRPPRG